MLKTLSLLFSSATISLLSLGIAAPAFAGEHHSMKDYPEIVSYGLYFEARVGGAILDEFDADMSSANVAGANGALGIEPDEGFGFELALGKYFNQHWRADVSLAWGHADDLTIDYSGAPANPLSAGAQPVDSLGDITTTSLLFNVYRTLDYRIGRLQPFVGAGIGFTHIEIDNVAPNGSRFIVDDSDVVFTFVHHLGFDMPLSEKADLTFRYTGIYSTEGNFSSRDTFNAGGIMNVETDSEYIPAVSAGIRIKLN
jgi:opacity protein-like surface antigen